MLESVGSSKRHVRERTQTVNELKKIVGGQKSGCNPNCKCGTCRLCVLAERAAQGLDLWTGEKLKK